MKTNKYCLFTNKINFNNEDNIIYNLMIKGGLIRKLCSGIFIILPNGLKIINNIIKIIKHEMDKLNSLEIEMPIIIPSYLWINSNRINNYGKELYKIYDRNNKLFLISPTNEEIITDFFFKERFNLNKLPYIFYQINNKFRDEIRPKSGLVRCKQFIMKDAYSFHDNKECLNSTYIDILNTYLNIFKILNLNIFYKEANCGKMGGYLSHEFHIISNYGENNLFIKKTILSKYFYNCDINSIKYKKFDFLFLKNINNNIFINKINLNKFIKTFLIKIYQNNKKIFVILLISYYSEIDFLKIKNLYPLSTKLCLVSNKYILKKFNINYLYLGPFGFNYRIIVDLSLINFKNFIIGSNINNYFFINVNWNKHINNVNFIDINKNYNIYIKKYNKKKTINKKSIELAHIFKLLDKYSKYYSKKLNFKKIFMGCYGIGIFRIFFSLIEKYSFNNKIIFPLSITNFKLGIIPIGMYINKLVYNISYKIYYFLIKKHIKVLLENRNIYIGKSLNDFELIGIPNFLIISKNLLFLNILEFRDRINKFTQYININEIFDFLLLKYL